MGGLTNALRELNITGAEAEYILRSAQAYVKEGFPAQEANERAIKDVIAETEKQIKDVSTQINGKGTP